MGIQRIIADAVKMTRADAPSTGYDDYSNDHSQGLRTTHREHQLSYSRPRSKLRIPAQSNSNK
jgi:hypothetical protein